MEACVYLVYIIPFIIYLRVNTERYYVRSSRVALDSGLDETRSLDDRSVSL